MQSNGTVIIAYSWFYDELQASEFLNFPFSKLKLKFSISNGGTLKFKFQFHYQIAICYSEKYRCSTKNEFQFPFRKWNFSLSNWNMKWKVSWNWANVMQIGILNLSITGPTSISVKALIFTALFGIQLFIFSNSNSKCWFGTLNSLNIWIFRLHLCNAFLFVRGATK